MLAKGKHKGLEVVFGMGGKGMGPEEDDTEHKEAEDTLKDALKSSGMDEDAVESVVPALHAYIEACMKYHKEPDEDDTESEEY